MKFKHWIEYLFVRGLESFLRILPYSFALYVGRGLGLFLSVLLPKRRRLIKNNLKRAFPQKSEKELNRIAIEMWQNIGRTAIEFTCHPTLSEKNINDFIVWKGEENVSRALELKKGIVLVTAHFTNWEISGYATQYKFGRLMAIARPMKNPMVEKWVQAKRSEGGNRIALHRNAVRTSLKWIKNNNIIAVLVDQNLYTGGVFVNFFGQPAATTTFPGLLHIRTGCPVLFTYTLRQGNKFIVHYDTPFNFPEIEDDSERLTAYTQIINDRVEEIVRQYPENWFWIHNRWKRQPEPIAVDPLMETSLKDES